jgi:hypothetical protein
LLVVASSEIVNSVALTSAQPLLTKSAPLVEQPAKP